MAEVNRIYEELGLPAITKEEHEDLTQTVASLADPESLSDTVLADTSADASGGNKLDNVFYVSFNPKKETLSSQWQAKFDALKENVDLNAQFMSIKANESVKAKIDSKELPENDETKKANYKAKVINHLAQNCPWTAGFAIRTLNKSWKVEKDTFHKALVTDFTQGLSLPDSILSQLEGFLTNIKSTINSSKDASQNLMFFILLTIYAKDDVAQTFLPYIRTIYFRVDQSLSNFTKAKDDKSSGVDLTVKVDYVQSDGQFNDKLFVANAKESIEALSSGKSKDMFSKPINVSVDP